DPGRQRQRRVRCRHRIHVVDLAARRRQAVKITAVPRGHTARAVTLARLEHVIALAEHVVERQVAARAALGLAASRGGARRPAQVARLRRAAGKRQAEHYADCRRGPAAARDYWAPLPLAAAYRPRMASLSW